MAQEQEADFNRLTPAMKRLIHAAYVHQNYRCSVYGRDVDSARMLERGGFVRTWDINHGIVIELTELGKKTAQELGGRSTLRVWHADHALKRAEKPKPSKQLRAPRERDDYVS
jgi:hypothetical protein